MRDDKLNYHLKTCFPNGLTMDTMRLMMTDLQRNIRNLWRNIRNA